MLFHYKKYAMKPQKKKASPVAFALLSAILFLNSCFHKQDQTTVVYGTITDEKGQPVDSILVIVQGVKGFIYRRLGQQYSDHKGEYEITLEVPKEFVAVNAAVPFSFDENPKLMRHFKDTIGSKSGKSTGNCCTAQIGEKTRYDFELIAK
jgi:hypothetical protein